MCGFAGVVHWDGEPVDRLEVADLADRLRHRGPDERRTAMPEPGVGLAHARLKVVDLSDHAAQPMRSEDGQVRLVYNGEIYNFQELRRELEAAGARFTSRSDTEVVLQAYLAWGPGFVRRLDGMFALAIWDARVRQLVLARDRVGKKPLFYYTDGRCVTFGSEIKALLGHAHVPCEVDEAALPFVLTFGYPPSGTSCYRHVRQLPPASTLILRAGDAAAAPETYWDIAFTAADGRADPRESAREVRRRLEAAVDRRLVADVPLGAFLSGGIDSTIITGLMAARMPAGAVRTFSIGFDGDPAYDETRYARLAAERFGTTHQVFTVGAQPFELVERLVWHHDQPFGDSSALPTYLLCQLAREHVTVALAGDGGDELFAGYQRFSAALLAERLPRWFSAAMHAWLSGAPAKRERSVLRRFQRFFDGARRPLPASYLSWLTYLDEGWRNGAPIPASMAGWWDRTAGQSTMSRLLYLNFKEYLPNDLMVKTDRCSMGHGLEVRAPLLDTALIEFVASLPSEPGKQLLRRACADLLPCAIADRGKMGFGAPLGAWFRGPWRQPLIDVLGSPQARLGRYVDIARVRALIQAHLDGTQDAGQRLWLLLTLELWLHQLSQPRAPGAFRAAIAEEAA